MKSMVNKSKMKKTVPVAMAAVWFVFSSVAVAGTIAGSAHDFRKQSANESGEICQPCHTPHQTKMLPMPLWNNELPTETYSLYTTTAGPVPKKANAGFQPNSSSKMCLSCHDGTIAPETFGDVSEGSICLQGDVPIGTGLDNDHPISFVYDAALSVSYGKLYDPSTKLSGVAGSKGTIKEDMLFQGKMECSSCHDVHNTRAVAGTKLLLKDNAGSGLCLTCHDL